jgi:hypothetical protein
VRVYEFNDHEGGQSFFTAEVFAWLDAVMGR